MKAKVIMLENDNSSPSKVTLFKHCKTNKLSFWEDWMSMDKNWYGFELYLIDKSADIKEGDWYYYSDLIKGISILRRGISNAPMSKCGSNFVNSRKPTKIIASTDKSLGLPQLSEQSIKLLIDYYNQYGKIPDDVEVEENYEKIAIYNFAMGLDEEIINIIKLNPEGTVNIIIPERKESIMDAFDRGFTAGHAAGLALGLASK